MLRPSPPACVVLLTCVLLSACGSTLYNRQPLAQGSRFDKSSYYGALQPSGTYRVEQGVHQGGTVVFSADYIDIWPIGSDDRLAVARRWDNGTLDLLFLGEGHLRHTRCTSMTWRFGAHGLTLIGRAPGHMPGREDVVLLDPRGNEFSSIFVKPGASKVYLHAETLIVDSVDDHGQGYASIHNHLGLPISPMLAPLVHTQYVEFGRYWKAGAQYVRLPDRVFPGSAQDLFGPGGTVPCVVVGALPRTQDISPSDHRLLRPLLADGSLAPMPVGAVGWLPVHLDDKLFTAPDGQLRVGTYTLHTHWAIVYPRPDGFRFAVGKGDLRDIASAADRGDLPLYDRLIHLRGSVSEHSDLGMYYPEQGEHALYVVQDAVTKAWYQFDGETWTPSRNGDNGGAGFASEAEARRAETSEQTAVREARLRVARLEAARIEQQKEQRRKEIEERNRVELARRLAAIDYNTPSEELRDLALRSGDGAVWDRYLLTSQAITTVDLSLAAHANASRRALQHGRSQVDERSKKAYEARQAELEAEMAKARQREQTMRWEITSSYTAPASNAGMEYLGKIGYEAMAQQNTRAWASGGNAWGRSWAP